METLTASTKRLTAVILGFVMMLGFSITGFIALADDNTSPAAIVYIDGVNGSDDNSGTSAEEPVKTFGKLEGIAADDATVYVVNTVTFTGSDRGEKVNLHRWTLKRAAGLDAPLIEVNKGAALGLDAEGATIDGEGRAVNAPLIAVDHATLAFSKVTLTGGHNSTDKVFAEGTNAQEAVPTDTWAGMGGALGARVSIVLTKDTQFKGNQATLGGAIFIDGGELELDENTVLDGNTAKWDGTDGSHVQNSYAAGGAIMALSAHYATNVNVRPGVTLSNNSAPAGGAIALGRQHTDAQPNENGYLQGTDQEYLFNIGAEAAKVTVAGGTFDKNSAESAGGAIFVQAGTEVEITGGDFTNNTAEGLGPQDFAGGAIYVQDAKENIPTPGRLVIKKALLVGNTADVEGGAIAFCATGDGFVGNTEGATIFGNTANGENHSEVVVTIKDVSKNVSLSSQALNGVENNWVGTGDPSNINTQGFFRNDLSEEDKARASEGALVRFEGNSTKQRGGALAVNGALEIGNQLGVFYIKKVDSVTRNPLGGAKFTLTGIDDDNKGIVKVAATAEQGDMKGITAFRGLTPGRYELTESQPPAGYQLQDSRWEVDVADDFSVTLTTPDGVVLDVADTITESHGLSTFDLFELENVAPTLGTLAINGDTFLKTIDLTDASTEASVYDTLAYNGLQPNATYTIKGVLVNKADGEPVAYTSTLFEPIDSVGITGVMFNFDVASFKEKGITQLVAYEYLFSGDVLNEDIDLSKAEENDAFVTKHEDLTDEDQTISIRYTRDAGLPEIGTAATDNADGDKTIAADAKAEVKDVVIYKGLDVGSTYTVKGKLVVKGTGGKDVVATAQTTFVPSSADGEVAVIFSIDPEKLAGKDLVAYEYLFDGDVTGDDIDLTTAESNANFVAKHEDDNDAAQTVTVSPNLPITGGLAKTGSAVAIGTIVSLGMIVAGFTLRRRFLS